MNTNIDEFKSNSQSNIFIKISQMFNLLFRIDHSLSILSIFIKAFNPTAIEFLTSWPYKDKLNWNPSWKNAPIQGLIMKNETKIYQQ